MPRLFPAAAAALLLGAGALPAQATASGERINYLHVVARDYVFEAKPTIPSGIVTLHLQNQGADLHHLILVELPTSRTPKEFFDVNRSTGQMPSWAKVIAQTGTLPTNGELFLTQRLAAGRYVLTCQLAASDGRSHVAKGMYQLLTVTPASEQRRVAGTD